MTEEAVESFSLDQSPQEWKWTLQDEGLIPISSKKSQLQSERTPEIPTLQRCCWEEEDPPTPTNADAADETADPAATHSLLLLEGLEWLHNSYQHLVLGVWKTKLLALQQEQQAMLSQRDAQESIVQRLEKDYQSLLQDCYNYGMTNLSPDNNNDNEKKTITTDDQIVLECRKRFRALLQQHGDDLLAMEQRYYSIRQKRTGKTDNEDDGGQGKKSLVQKLSEEVNDTESPVASMTELFHCILLWRSYLERVEETSSSLSTSFLVVDNNNDDDIGDKSSSKRDWMAILSEMETRVGSLQKECCGLSFWTNNKEVMEKETHPRTLLQQDRHRLDQGRAKLDRIQRRSRSDEWNQSYQQCTTRIHAVQNKLEKEIATLLEEQSVRIVLHNDDNEPHQ